MDSVEHWPYAPTFARLGLALAIGLFVGIERERRGKEAALAPLPSRLSWVRWVASPEHLTRC